MPRHKKLYEGKAKIIFEGPEPGTIIQHFKDDATAFNAEKHALISGKGVLNNRISAHLMSQLEVIGIPTTFIRQLNMREQLVRQVDIIPIELVVRNVAAGRRRSGTSAKARPASALSPASASRAPRGSDSTSRSMRMK